MNNYIGTKYPNEVDSVVRDQTLSVESHLFLATAADGNKPLEIYNGFSRFIFTIINRDKVTAMANVPVEMIEEIAKRTDAALTFHLENEMKKSLQEQQSATATPQTAAYTTRLTDGPLSGKSPAEVLLSDPEGAEKLNKAYQAMSRNVAEHPEYKEQMDAIREAATLFKERKLEAPSADNGAAYTVRIANGNLKGKTPAEVLQEDAAGGERALTSQKAWLEKNLDKYPGNQKQIDAINAALRLKQSGQLGTGAPSGTLSEGPYAGKVVTIYDAKYRPLRSKKKENGKCLIYFINVSWVIGQEYPVIVKITNYYAPVATDAKTGRLNVIAREAEGQISCEMRLKSDEWNNTLRKIKANMRQFETLHARDSINDAADADRRNRAASSKSAV